MNGTTTADNEELDEFSVLDEYYWEDTDTSIVVGYAFGPKKMSTMGVVMAEASRTRLTTTTTNAGLNNNNNTSLLTTDALQQHTASPQQVEIIFDVRKIVRHFHSSCSSVADSTTTSTGTRTASTISQHPTTIPFSSSGGNNNSIISNSNGNKVPVRVSFVPLDPNVPIEDQHGGRIDVILHKLTEDILVCSQHEEQQEQRALFASKSKQGESIDLIEHDDATTDAMGRVQRLCEFSSKHACPLVDDPRQVQRLMSRAKIAATLQQALQGVTSTTGRRVAAPEYAVLPCNSNNKAAADSTTTTTPTLLPPNLTFPLMVKPLTAAGTKASHSMAVVLKPEGLQQVDTPCLCQAYVNHNAWLYKVYVLGEFCSVHKRRSLPNLPTQNGHSSTTTTQSLVAFDSQRPYPRLRDFGYNVDTAVAATGGVGVGVDAALGNNNNSSTHHPNHTTLTAEEVQPVVHALKQAFGIELFGFDVLVSADNDALLVVDVNYFPSYKEVPNFAALLAKFLTDKALERRGGETTTERTSSAATNSTLATADGAATTSEAGQDTASEAKDAGKASS